MSSEGFSIQDRFRMPLRVCFKSKNKIKLVSFPKACKISKQTELLRKKNLSYQKFIKNQRSTDSKRATLKARCKVATDWFPRVMPWSADRCLDETLSLLMRCCLWSATTRSTIFQLFQQIFGLGRNSNFLKKPSSWSGIPKAQNITESRLLRRNNSALNC